MNARRIVRLAGAAIGLAAVVVTLGAAAAGAHPLGNFTVNRYARLEVSAGLIRIYYVLDEAEIPTFQDRDALHADRATFIRQRSRQLANNLTLRIDEHAEALTPVTEHLTLPAGQAGLATLRLAIVFEVHTPTNDAHQPRMVTFTDRNEPDRIGWREIIVTTGGNATLITSNAPNHDLSDELRHYPANLIQAPLNLRDAQFTYLPGTITAPARDLTAPKTAPRRAGSGFTDLIKRQGVTPAVFVGMVAVALVFGAGHALAPGHGKTIMAAYLVGTHGRPVDALLIGLIVSSMHTASVLVLAFVLFRIGPSVSPDRIYPALTLTSGVAVVAVGASLLVTRTRRLQQRRATNTDHHDEPGAVGGGATGSDDDQDHEQDASHPAPHPVHTSDHGHHHQHTDDPTRSHDALHSPAAVVHSHAHGPHGHSHELPEGVAPLSRRGLAILATSGGILPSPSAVIVLVAAFTAGRATLGLALVGAFSLGLAATLTAVGLILVVGGRLAGTRLNTRIVPLLPLLGAAAITILGLIISAQGIRTLR